MAKIQLKSWKDINDEIWYTLRRSCNGLIDPELTRSSLSKNPVVDPFMDCEKKEALKISRDYFKKWIYIINERVLFEQNKELETDLRKIYDCNFGYYFSAHEFKEDICIYLIELDFVDVEQTIGKMRDIIKRGPTEIELLFTPELSKKKLQERLVDIMNAEVKEIRKKHNEFLVERKNELYTYIDCVTEKVISKYKN